MSAATTAEDKSSRGTRFNKTQVRALPLTRSPVSRVRGVVGSGGGSKTYLPTFLTSLIGGNGDRRSQVPTKATKRVKSDCNYQLLPESEGLLSAFDEDYSEREEEEEGEEDLDLPGGTVINMRILNSSTVSKEIRFSVKVQFSYEKAPQCRGEQ